MSRTVTSIEEIDLDISVAYIELGAARTSFRRWPSAEHARRVEEAESYVDRLLDRQAAAR